MTAGAAAPLTAGIRATARAESQRHARTRPEAEEGCIRMARRESRGGVAQGGTQHCDKGASARQAFIAKSAPERTPPRQSARLLDLRDLHDHGLQVVSHTPFDDDLVTFLQRPGLGGDLIDTIS